MKKCLTNIVISAIFYIATGSMVLGVYSDWSQFVGVGAVSFWILIFTGIFRGCIYGLTVSALDSLVSDESRNAVTEPLQKFVKKKHIIFRLWGWACFIAAVALVAYSGWILTAVCYVLASLFVSFIASVVRNKLQQPGDRLN